MKKILFLILPIFLFGQSFLISNIPIPRTYIQNLDPYECNEACMQEFIDNGMIFSFLAHADSKLENVEQDEIRMMNIAILNLGSHIISDKLRIAMLLPYKTIGKYAASTTNAAFAYLIAKNRSFELKSYQIESESVEDIREALNQIAKDDFYYVIAPLTQSGSDAVSEINPQMNIYFPTINKEDVQSTSSFLYYGGIDYRAQSNLLLKEAVSPLVIFYDQSDIGHKLAMYEEQRFTHKDVADMNLSLSTEEVIPQLLERVDSVESMEENRTVVKFSIPRRTTNLEEQLKENEEIKKGSFFLNTPIVKSGMIMSQLTLYDTNSTNVLSTQINYDPLLLSMTQYTDRKNMIVANSITQNNNVIIETNSLLGNDIVYDWINYTTTVGMDYFFNKITNDEREYKIDVQENQMMYQIELLQPSLSRFIKYFSTLE
ncbi:MAG: hypothetical protein GW906_10025 [Epsilonproteobacteria bacterium]|nr:hypothetical protein [Campylobacterota bacterium]OIO14778.1 MAG: hypothetical protein AUJ81_08665 [Helicobacteraceae bacterium CG1_02_36_14]PIP09270.1 MAG: hypothetical protein COX50_11815 [Sulfurimonas sp. CG23_combo_of_CG06-09_8_20_14_all_36_33]PIS25744.1 MAG: hypothetical protein COT46_05005 [Sulfurimonas sp. CG08_land_8_20_14_0_20_36_33]PIU34592.1 MAG: hypothetical protein COT05_06915 [Sulfurimonas sp. CG07_land_8_20_14_0_80_36_56]PIV04801.1 MAG: hypothetical protein COS56_03625 [Sulfur